MAGETEIGELLRGRLKDLPIERVEAKEVPEPYHSLLCHTHDMTSSLARFHGGEVSLQVFGVESEGDDYLREVLLKVGEKPVEYGVIRIFLKNFPDDLRPKIRDQVTPLGAILNDSGLSYYSRPLGFLRIMSQDFQPDFFPLVDGKFLFGRYNELLDAGDRVLARIIEILPYESS
ncbi:MAG: hypothetical protein PVJ98_02375 [Akkermansiaceae bacterium]|jgi:hypothetical protein